MKNEPKHPKAVRLYLTDDGPGFVPRRGDGTYEPPNSGNFDYIEITIGDEGVYVRCGEGGLSVEPRAANHVHVTRRPFR